MSAWITFAWTVAGCAGSHESSNPLTDGVVEVATPVLEVPEDSEVQDCHFLALPTDAPICVGTIEVELGAGVHHAAVYRDGSEVPGTTRHGCWETSELPPALFESDEETSWTLPPGRAWRFGARDRLMVLVHAVNVATQWTEDLRTSVTIRLELVDCEGTTDVVPFEIPDEGQRTCEFPGDATVLAAQTDLGTLEIAGTSELAQVSDVVRDLDVQMSAGDEVAWRIPERDADYDDVFGPQVEYDEEGTAFIHVAPTIAGIVCW